MKMKIFNRVRRTLSINILLMRETPTPSQIKGTGTPKGITITGVDLKIRGDTEGVEIAETEVNKANMVTGIKIEIQIPIDNGDSKIMVLVTVIKVIEAVPEMRVTTIIITEGIIIQEEAIGATLRVGVAIETFNQMTDPHPYLTLINTVRFAIKQVICLTNVSL